MVTNGAKHMARKVKKAHKPSLGSISHGTLRAADLLVAFADELEWVQPRGNAKLIAKARKAAAHLEDGSDSPDIFHDDLLTAIEYKLGTLAPPFTYFGANEGDGSDFGWWPDMDAIDELPTEGDSADDEKLFGEFKTVSDHGNVEVYYRSRNGRVKSIIGVV